MKNKILIFIAAIFLNVGLANAQGILGANPIMEDQIADNAITATKLSDNAITATDLADNSITNIKITDNTLAFGKLASLNSPTDEFCLTYEAAGTAFEWTACSGGGGGDTTDNSTNFTPTFSLVGGTGNSVGNFDGDNKGVVSQIGDNRVFVDVALTSAEVNNGGWAGTGVLNMDLPANLSSDVNRMNMPCGRADVNGGDYPILCIVNTGFNTMQFQIQTSFGVYEYITGDSLTYLYRRLLFTFNFKKAS